MNDPNANVTRLAVLIDTIRDHPMCRRFEETEMLYRVLYPPGFRLDGVQASVGGGKAAALDRILTAMEKHWTEG